MDRYARGSQLRLVQSYSGGTLEREGVDDSFTYDDALIIDALLARGEPEDLARAEVLGRSLLYVQEHDPAGDGRIRAAYAPTPLSSPADVTATDPTSDVGNMAWVGQALVHLYERTGTPAFLSGAREIAQWIQTEAYDERGAGRLHRRRGTRRQPASPGSPPSTTSTCTRSSACSRRPPAKRPGARPRPTRGASWKRCGNRRKGMFWVGTGEDGVKPNRHLQVEDVNSWSYLALRDPRFASSLDWVVKNLAVTQEGLQRRELLPARPQGRVVRGHRAPRRRPARAGRTGRRRSRRALPGGHRTRPAGRARTTTARASSRPPGTASATAKANRISPRCTRARPSWYVLAAQGVDPFEPLQPSNGFGPPGPSADIDATGSRERGDGSIRPVDEWSGTSISKSRSRSRTRFGAPERTSRCANGSSRVPVAVGFFAAVAVIWAAWPPHGFEAAAVRAVPGRDGGGLGRALRHPLGFTPPPSWRSFRSCSRCRWRSCRSRSLLALLLGGGFEVWRRQPEAPAAAADPRQLVVRDRPRGGVRDRPHRTAPRRCGSAADRAGGPVRGRLRRLDAALRRGPGRRTDRAAARIVGVPDRHRPHRDGAGGGRAGPRTPASSRSPRCPCWGCSRGSPASDASVW